MRVLISICDKIVIPDFLRLSIVYRFGVYCCKAQVFLGIYVEQGKPASWHKACAAGALLPPTPPKHEFGSQKVYYRAIAVPENS